MTITRIGLPGSTDLPSVDLFPGNPVKTVAAVPKGALPHFAFPFRRDRGKVVVVAQDTIAHVQSSALAILACPVGSFGPDPEFGYDDPTFRQIPVQAAALAATVGRFEPRANVTGTEEGVLGDMSARHVTLEMEV